MPSNKEQRAKDAHSHYLDFEKRYAEQIKYSIAAARPFGPEPVRGTPGGPSETTLRADDSVSALYRLPADAANVYVHNFASYTRPGGGFLSGAMAQEEALCAESSLANVLTGLGEFYDWNRAHMAGGLYEDRILVTPNIAFERDGQVRYAHVLTCAAPNLNRSRDQASNHERLASRIDMVFSVLERTKAKTFITGAWGCGVFGQDPHEVAKLILDRASTSSVQSVILAVPDASSSNFKAFREIMKQKG